MDLAKIRKKARVEKDAAEAAVAQEAAVGQKAAPEQKAALVVPLSPGPPEVAETPASASAQIPEFAPKPPLEPPKRVSHSKEEAETQAISKPEPSHEPELPEPVSSAPLFERADRGAPPASPASAAGAAAEPGRTERMLIFALGKERYAIPIFDITLIIENRPATPIPNTPPFVLGIISLRGKIVTVIDMRLRLGLDGQGVASESAKVVIVDKATDQFGLLVDAIEQVLEVDMRALEPPPEGFRSLEQDFVEGVFYFRNHVVATLNLDQFLSFEVARKTE